MELLQPLELQDKVMLVEQGNLAAATAVVAVALAAQVALQVLDLLVLVALELFLPSRAHQLNTLVAVGAVFHQII
jgi:hypothetical protein